MKRTARAALANRGPIADALASRLPASGTVLELGSGTGEHLLLLAARFPALRWLPSDPDLEARASIVAWAMEARLPNLLAPRAWDLRGADWHAFPAAAVLCLNVLHVAPPECAAALAAGAARVLPPGGPLFVYGPFAPRGAAREGRLARLDRNLRAHDPALGVRDLEELVEPCAAAGLALVENLPMPEEGDLLLVFRRG